MKWYFKALENYTNFSGRAHRTEYWSFTLINLLFGFLALVIDNLLGLAFIEGLYGPVYGVYSLGMLIPSLALATRRLHDVNKSGWLLLLAFLPLVGPLILLVFLLSKGNEGENQYGLNTKVDGIKGDEAAESQDQIIISIVAWMIAIRLFYMVMNNFLIDYYQETWFKMFNAFTTLVWACIPLLLSFMVKGETSRQIVRALAILYLIFGLYEAGRILWEILYAYAI